MTDTDPLSLLVQAEHLRRRLQDLCMLARVTYAAGEQKSPDALVSVADESDGLVACCMAIASDEGCKTEDVLFEVCRRQYDFDSSLERSAPILGVAAVRRQRCMQGDGHRLATTEIGKAISAVQAIGRLLADMVVGSQRSLSMQPLIASSVETDERQQEIAYARAGAISVAYRHSRELEVALVRVRSMFVLGAAQDGITTGEA